MNYSISRFYASRSTTTSSALLVNLLLTLKNLAQPTEIKLKRPKTD